MSILKLLIKIHIKLEMTKEEYYPQEEYHIDFHLIIMKEHLLQLIVEFLKIIHYL